MQFSVNRKIISKDKYLAEQLFDSIEYMKEVVDVTTITHHRIIKRLATELCKIFIETKHKRGESKKGVSLWEYVLKDIRFPKVLCVEDIIRENVESARKMGVENLGESVYAASSLVVSDGAYKPIIIKGEKTDLKGFLDTIVVRLPKGEKEKGVCRGFSIRNVIKLMRQKETAHIDSDILDKEGEEDFTLLREFEQRYLIVLGVVEYVITLYEMHVGSGKSHYLDLPDGRGFAHLKQYEKNALGVSLPTLFVKEGSASGVMTTFLLYRKICDNEKYEIFTMGSVRLYVNSNSEIILQAFDDTPQMVRKVKEVVKDKSSGEYSLLSQTLSFYNSWGYYEAILNKTDFAESVLDTIDNDVELCRIVECRARAWLCVGNVLASKKLYKRLKGADAVKKERGWSQYIEQRLQELEMLVEK